MEDKILKFKELLISKIDSYLARGGKLVSRIYGSLNEEECCALNVLYKEKGGGSDPFLMGPQLFKFVNDQYGFDFMEHEYRFFIRGFDSTNINPNEHSMQNLGKEIRNKYPVEEI